MVTTTRIEMRLERRNWKGKEIEWNTESTLIRRRHGSRIVETIIGIRNGGPIEIVSVFCPVKYYILIITGRLASTAALNRIIVYIFIVKTLSSFVVYKAVVETR